MNPDTPSNLRLFAFFIVLIAVTCSPIWGVQYFLVQDGSPHVYNGYLMAELLKGNPFVSEYLVINPIPMPNSSGHWIIVLLLTFLSPFAITKLMMTLTFAGVVAAMGWLRYAIVGREGVMTSMLIGAAVGFNWMWLVGFYNFMIGVAGFIFTIGLYYAWREKLSVYRALALSFCILFVYLSHLIGFAALAGSLVVLVFMTSRDRLKRNFLWLAAASLPVIPLIVLYKLASTEVGGYSAPHWELLSNPLSVTGWISQALSADPFILISRKTLPFTTLQSSSLLVFSPGLWTFVSFAVLAAATIYSRSRRFLVQRENLPFTLLLLLFLIVSLIAPDDFGLKNGAVLRPRVLVCGLCFIVPLFRTAGLPVLKRIAQGILLAVIAFQTLVVWEYAITNDRTAREFIATAPAIEEHESVASVALIEGPARFHAMPETQTLNLLGIDRNIVVWDNYELGLYYFPIVPRDPADRQFAFDMMSSHGFILNDPQEMAVFDERLALLDACLTQNNSKIDKLFVYGSDPRVEGVLRKWFASEPMFEHGRIRIFKHH